jgi:type II secretory pathway component PulK
VLVAVLAIVMLLSMLALSLLFRIQAEGAASAAGMAGEQAWAAAMAGVQEALRVARESPAGALEWQDAPRLFRDRLVLDDGADRWYFTVYSAAGSDGSEEVRFGLTDESAKLNLNTATETNLTRLPRLTIPLAQTLLDFIDADDEPHPEGAEQEYYDLLAHPYAIRNGPLATVDELLLVRGFTPALLDGEDANRNLVLDPNENDMDQSFPPDNGDGRLDFGLRPWVTVHSIDANVDHDGVPRTNINDPDDPLPRVRLPESLVAYLEAVRTNRVRIAEPADLLEARTKVKDASGQEVQLDSGVGKAELPVVLDLLTTVLEDRQAGRINVNAAPKEVLATLPEIDESLAEAIVAARRGVSAERRQTVAWLYTEDLVDADLFRRIAPRLTARGSRYGFHVVGFGRPSGRFRVFEVIVDTLPGEPEIAYLRELTRLGVPYGVRNGMDETGG